MDEESSSPGQRETLDLHGHLWELPLFDDVYRCLWCNFAISKISLLACGLLLVPACKTTKNNSKHTS